MPRNPKAKGSPVGGRPAERARVSSAFREWLEQLAAREKVSYAQTVTNVAEQLSRTRQHVYALANGTTKPSRPLAAAIEGLSKGKVDAVKSW